MKSGPEPRGNPRQPIRDFIPPLKSLRHYHHPLRDLILKGKSLGSCGEGFEGDAVADGLELGNGPTRFSSLVAATGHGGLISQMPVTAVRTALSPARDRPSAPKGCVQSAHWYAFIHRGGDGCWPAYLTPR